MDDMPLTVEHYLLVEPEIRALRRRLDYTPPEAHRVRAAVEQQLADLTELQRQRWLAGEAGWMTADEARSVAARLTEQADTARIDARAEVRGERLVLSGGRQGEVLRLAGIWADVEAARALRVERCRKAGRRVS